jgi:hypothetical protein
MTIEKKFEEVKIEKLRQDLYQICLRDLNGGFYKKGREKNIRSLYDFITQIEKNLGYKPNIQFATKEIENDIKEYVINLTNKKYKYVEPEQLKLEIDGHNPRFIYKP